MSPTPRTNPITAPSSPAKTPSTAACTTSSPSSLASGRTTLPWVCAWQTRSLPAEATTGPTFASASTTGGTRGTIMLSGKTDSVGTLWALAATSHSPSCPAARGSLQLQPLSARTRTLAMGHSCGWLPSPCASTSPPTKPAGSQRRRATPRTRDPLLPRPALSWRSPSSGQSTPLGTQEKTQRASSTLWWKSTWGGSRQDPWWAVMSPSTATRLGAPSGGSRVWISSATPSSCASRAVLTLRRSTPPTSASSRSTPPLRWTERCAGTHPPAPPSNKSRGS
mmetsp:Transcript_30150/g.87816  ORF Transcript_30150/g.87816 Transcript_30150/m.87816 type:complete len:280 (+) Transcript_30150:800-1639(+)